MISKLNVSLPIPQKTVNIVSLVYQGARMFDFLLLNYAVVFGFCSFISLVVFIRHILQTTLNC